jgi:hypothetical protein
MVRKILGLTFCLLIGFVVPAWGAVKVEWDTNGGWSDAGNDWAWNTGLITSGDWSLGSKYAFFLKGNISTNQDDEKRWRGELNRCYLQYEQESLRLNIGKQGVSWGIGWFFRPTDLITPLTPLAQEETRPGKNLAVIRWSTSPLTATDFIAGDQLLAARSEWRMGPTNFRLLGIYQPEYINALGFDFQGGLGGLYGEGTSRWAADQGIGQGKFAGILGWRKVIGQGNQLYVEYFYNGLSQAGGRLTTFLGQNMNNERLYRDQNYLAIGLKIPWDQLTTYSVTGITNLDDGSTIYIGNADAELTDNVELIGTITIIGGSDTSEFIDDGNGSRAGVSIQLKYVF